MKRGFFLKINCILFLISSTLFYFAFTTENKQFKQLAFYENTEPKQEKEKISESKVNPGRLLANPFEKGSILSAIIHDSDKQQPSKLDVIESFGPSYGQQLASTSAMSVREVLSLLYSPAQIITGPDINDEWDPIDNEPFGATELGSPQSVETSHGPHTLSETDFYDWFSFQLTQGSEYVFESIGDSDTFGELFMEDGTTNVITDDDSGNSSNFEIEFTPESDGIYLLRVRAYTIGDQASYELTFKTRTPVIPPAPTAVYVNPIEGSTLEESDIMEIAGTFSGMPPALITITDILPADSEEFGVEGNALRITVQPGEGSLLFFSNAQPIEVPEKALVRASVWSSNPSAQVFVGLMDTDAEGNLTGAVLGMDQLLETQTLTKNWRIITAIHETQSGYVKPIVQVAGNVVSSEVYVDNIEVYLINKDAIYTGELLGAMK